MTALTTQQWLDFLARTDLDGRAGGQALAWVIVQGFGATVFGLLFVALVWAFLSGHPRHLTKVVHRHHPDQVVIPARAAQEDGAEPAREPRARSYSQRDGVAA